jgi:hypothetical protein
MDYLSTVSGGGYFGSFLGRLFTRPWINGEQPAQSAPKAHRPTGAPSPTSDAPPPWSTPSTSPPEASVWDTSNMFRLLGLIPGKAGDDVRRCYNKDANPAHAEGLTDQSPGVARVEYILNCPASKPMSWLRDNGRYLSPNGTSDMLTDASLAVRNWVALTAVMGLFLILGFWVSICCAERFGISTRSGGPRTSNCRCCGRPSRRKVTCGGVLTFIFRRSFWCSSPFHWDGPTG